MPGLAGATSGKAAAAAAVPDEPLLPLHRPPADAAALMVMPGGPLSRAAADEAAQHAAAPACLPACQRRCYMHPAAKHPGPKHRQQKRKRSCLPCIELDVGWARHVGRAGEAGIPARVLAHDDCSARGGQAGGGRRKGVGWARRMGEASGHRMREQIAAPVWAAFAHTAGARVTAEALVLTWRQLTCGVFRHQCPAAVCTRHSKRLLSTKASKAPAGHQLALGVGGHQRPVAPGAVARHASTLRAPLALQRKWASTGGGQCALQGIAPAHTANKTGGAINGWARHTQPNRKGAVPRLEPDAVVDQQGY